MTKAEINPGVYSLLRAISTDQQADILLSKGYTYGQIAQFISMAIEKEWLFPSKTNLSITTAGLAQIHNKNMELDQRGWIQPDQSRAIEILGPNEIYIPAGRTAKKIRSTPTG